MIDVTIHSPNIDRVYLFSNFLSVVFKPERGAGEVKLFFDTPACAVEVLQAAIDKIQGGDVITD